MGDEKWVAGEVDGGIVKGGRSTEASKSKHSKKTNNKPTACYPGMEPKLTIFQKNQGLVINR
jgi:hypothetical protein